MRTERWLSLGILGVVLGLAALLPARPAMAGCDNEDPVECIPCVPPEEADNCSCETNLLCEADCDAEDGPNHFEVYSANVRRSVRDLRLAVQVGEKPLEFRRMHSSRTSWAVQERTDYVFGRAGNWRHSHQWTILDDGIINGCQSLQVISPEGRVSYYNKKSANDLFMTYLPSTHSRIRPDGGTNFFLYELDGTKYHITQWGTPSNKTFRLEGFWDCYSNWYGYAYGADGYLSRVTGPNTNQFLAFSYRGLEGAVSPGTIRFTYSNAAATEVLIPGAWNNWAGAQTPMVQTSNGLWEADVPLPEGFYPYKFLYRTNSAAPWVWTADPENPLVVGDTGNSLAVVSDEKVLSQVTAGDGRSVNYVYDWVWDAATSALAMRLREVQYGTGESALYDYYAPGYDQGGAILLKSADDPHVSGAARAVLYTYHTNRPYSGQIHEEKLLASGTSLAALEYDAADPLVRRVVKAGGVTNEYTFVAGAANTASKADALGQTVQRTYFGGNGMLQSRTDPAGRTTTYTRTWHFGAILSVSNSCSCGGDRVNTYTDDTYPFYLATTTDAAGHTTTYTRDANHRPTAIDYPDGTRETITYNLHGQPLVHRRRDGTTWTNTYDARGRLAATAGPCGAVTTYTYDANDRLAATTDAAGLVTATERDWEGRPLRTTYPDGTFETWAYDRYGAVTQEVSRSGGVTTYAYDERGNLVRTTDPVGAVSTATYDLDGHKLTETFPSGLVVTNAYDALGRLVRRTYSSDGTSESWTYVYDGVSTTTDRLGRLTANLYDQDGHLVRVTDPRGSATEYAYDELGRRIQTLDPLGHATTLTLDPAGRILTVTDADGLATTHTYDTNGRLLRTIQRGGITNDFAYDALGRRTNVLLNGVSIGATAYDPAGRVLWTRNADGLAATNAYDAAGRLWRTFMPDGTYSENVYSNSWLYQTIDRAGRVTTTLRDPIGRVSAQIDPAGHTVAYRYDLSGNLTNLIDQAGTITAWTYDPEGRQTRKTYADGTHWDYTYDAEGQLTSRTDARGRTTTYAYDPNGNLVAIDYPNDPDVTFTYDALDRKTSITDATGTTLYAYDALGRVVSEGPVSYTYTAADELASVSMTNYLVEYAYDSLGRIDAVSYGTNEWHYTWLGGGRKVTSLRHPNGVLTTNTYDVLGHLLETATYGTNAAPLIRFAYTYDDSDQRTSVTREDGRVIQYQYDAIGQLTNALGGPYAFSYQYDERSNPLVQNRCGLVYSNTFNNLNQNGTTTFSGGLTVWGTSSSILAATVTVNGVTAQPWGEAGWCASDIPFVQGTNILTTLITDAAGRTSSTTTTVYVQDKTYAYDANGNMTANGAFTYVWDDENRLSEVWLNGILIQKNVYDALSRRQRKIEYASASELITQYIYDRWNILSFSDESSLSTEYCINGVDMSGIYDSPAGGIAGQLALDRGGMLTFQCFDGNGNVALRFFATDSVLSRTEYSPFGHLLCASHSNLYNANFSSKELDVHVGLVYFGYRYYSLALGRWLKRDPLGDTGQLLTLEKIGMPILSDLSKMSPHLLAYCYSRNNPISSIDYLGLATIQIGNSCTYSMLSRFYYKKEKEIDPNRPQLYRLPVKSVVADIDGLYIRDAPGKCRILKVPNHGTIYVTCPGRKVRITSSWGFRWFTDLAENYRENNNAEPGWTSGWYPRSDGCPRPAGWPPCP